MTTSFKRVAKVAVLSVGLAAASVASYCGVIVYRGNFHSVEDGGFYRSGQLSKDEFTRTIQTYRIKSILNLRGAHPTQRWYADEMTVSKELGVVHYDYGISARRPVTREQITRILEIVRIAPKPILVHCMSGADRAGFVAALYSYAIEGNRAEAADGQLSLLYGHFPYLTSGTIAMDESFWRYAKTSSAPLDRGRD